MCTCTDIIEAIFSSIIIPFMIRYECLQNIQADLYLAIESPGSAAAYIKKCSRIRSTGSTDAVYTRVTFWFATSNDII